MDNTNKMKLLKYFGFKYKYRLLVSDKPIMNSYSFVYNVKTLTRTLYWFNMKLKTKVYAVI